MARTTSGLLTSSRGILYSSVRIRLVATTISSRWAGPLMLKLTGCPGQLVLRSAAPAPGPSRKTNDEGPCGNEADDGGRCRPALFGHPCTSLRRLQNALRSSV